MYKKGILVLAAAYLVLLMAVLGMKGTKEEQPLTEPDRQPPTPIFLFCT